MKKIIVLGILWVFFAGAVMYKIHGIETGNKEKVKKYQLREQREKKRMEWTRRWLQNDDQ